MRIEVPRHRPASIRLTPLIDVVFILLVFFMLASSFLDWRSFDLALPAADAAPVDAEVEPVVVRIAADGSLRLDDERVAADALIDRVAALLADGDRPVRVRTADAAPVQATVDTLDRLRAAGAVTIALEEDAP